MSQLRILFLTPQLPYPPQQGSALRNYYLIKGLAEAGFDVDLLTFATAAQVADPSSGGPLRQLCRNLRLVPLPAPRSTRARLVTLLRGHSDMAARLASPHYDANLTTLLSENDYHAIQVEGIEMARYSLTAMRQYQGKAFRPRFTLDEHNAEYLLQQRVYQNDIRSIKTFAKGVYSFLQYRRLIAFEREVCRRMDSIIVVSAADKAAIVKLDANLLPRISVISNGVDTDEYAPNVAAPPADWPPTTVVFTAIFDYRPNVDAATWFVNSVWPQIVAVCPEARCYLVGARPAPAVQALASSSIIVTGAVEDVRPYIAGATLYVVPMRVGGGVRLKLLQAMSMGKAVLTTTLGAEGVEVIPQRDVAVADRAADFAARAITLLRDNAAREQLGHAARAAVMPYSWQNITPSFVNIVYTVQ